MGCRCWSGRVIISEAHDAVSPAAAFGERLADQITADANHIDAAEEEANRTRLIPSRVFRGQAHTENRWPFGKGVRAMALSPVPCGPGLAGRWWLASFSSLSPPGAVRPSRRIVGPGTRVTATPLLVRECLASEAGPKATDAGGATPLHWAAEYNQTPAVLTALINAGADPKARTKNGRPPLHRAAARNGRAGRPN